MPLPNNQNLIEQAIRTGNKFTLDCALFDSVLFLGDLEIIANNLKRFVIATNQSDIYTILQYFEMHGFKISKTITITEMAENIKLIRYGLLLESQNEFNKTQTEQTKSAPTESSLLNFIKEEVPYRLKEHHGLPESSITDELIDDCVVALDDDSDIMFDYDTIDKVLRDIISAHSIDPTANS